MLRNLRIERFKSVFEHDIEFGKVNLFVGPNGAGKSNVLEALGILAAALSSGIDAATLDVKGVRLSLPNQFKSAFKSQHLPRTFRLEAEFEHGRYDCSISASANRSSLEFSTEALYDKGRQVFGRSAHGVKLHSMKDQLPTFTRESVPRSRSVWSALEPFARISPEFKAELDAFSRFAIYAPQTAIMRGLAVDNRIVEPLGLTGSGMATALNTVLTQVPREKAEAILKVVWQPGWANEIRIERFNPDIVPAHVFSEGGAVLYIRDKFMRSGRDMLSAFDASEGTLYLIFVSTLLAHPLAPRIFALDNVDGTLNPKLVRSLSKHLVDVVKDVPGGEQRQVFMTSHHPSSLDSVDIFNNDEKIFVVSREQQDQKRRGQSNYFALKPPHNMTKAQWIEKHGGKNLSELLLNERIPGAL